MASDRKQAAVMAESIHYLGQETEQYNDTSMECQCK